MSQEKVDKDVASFKAMILAKVGDTPWPVVLASPKSKTIQHLAEYELYVRPEIIKKGFTAPTVSELFGIEIEFKFGSEPDSETVH